MLKLNNNIIFLGILYLLILLVEFFHFSSDIYLVIASESFLCFLFIFVMFSGIFQEDFIVGIHAITFKYNYICIYFKRFLKINTDIYTNFFKEYKVYLAFFFKSFVLLQNFKRQLIMEYQKRSLFFNNNSKILFKNDLICFFN